ncbi:MAG: hypothetical protein O3A82_07520 [Verrucomicrobia bacterium]|nr:hypothetical protein [Verrucomicrobiota bacterium]
MFLRCHCEERSGRVRQPPHRPGIPHDASDWIATSVLFETFLAMTKSEETWIATPRCGSQ